MAHVRQPWLQELTWLRRAWAADRDRAVLYVALATAAGSVGLFALWPRMGVGLAVFVALVVVPALWLVGRWSPHAVLGAFLYITILRPLPRAEDTAAADRALDAVWFVMAAAVVIYLYRRSGNRLRIWRGLYWLAASGVLVGVSLGVGALLGQPVVFRDLFELYRAPFYGLILLGATQVDWTSEHISQHLMKPLLAALAVSGVFALVQMDIYTGKDAVALVYYPKFSEWSYYDVGLLAQTSGTFSNPNWYGVALAVLLPVMWAASATVKRSWCIAPAVVFIAALLVLTGSRTALYAASVGAVVYAVAWVARRPTRGRHSSALPLLTVASWLIAVAILGSSAMLTARHHATTVALTRGLASEVRSLAEGFWPFDVQAESSAVPVKADDEPEPVAGTGDGEPAVDEPEPVAGTGDGEVAGPSTSQPEDPPQRGRLLDELRDATVAGRTNDSFDHKLDGSIARVKEVWARSPIFGLGPSKSVSRLLGDNQYTVVFYRYGLVGLFVWGGFWVALGWTALQTWWRRGRFDAPYGAAIVAMTSVMLVAGFGGAFFDARQIAIVFLLVAGIAMSARQNADGERDGSPLGRSPAEVS